MAWGNIFAGDPRKEFVIDGYALQAVFYAATNKKPPLLVLRTAGTFPAQAIFRRETAIDKMGKKIGIAAEIQLNDPQSDEAVYFECDDEDFVRRLFSGEETRAALRQLLQDFESLEISSNGCSVTKTGATNWIVKEPDRLVLAAEALVRIVKEIPLPSSGQKSMTPLTDNYQACVRRLLIISGGVLFSVIAGLVWAVPAFEPIMPRHVWIPSFKWSLPALMLFAWYVVPRLKGHAASLKALVQVLSMAVVGGLLGGFVVMVVLNGCLDASLPQRHDVMVVEKHSSRSKNSITYYVTVSSWRPDISVYKMDVPWKEYNAAQVGQPYVVVTRSGAFGFEWLAGHFSGRETPQDKQF